MNIKQELQSKYVFTVEYLIGPDHIVADALSRNPANDSGHEDNKEIDFKRISSITSSMVITDLNIVRSAKDVLNVNDTRSCINL